MIASLTFLFLTFTSLLAVHPWTTLSPSIVNEESVGRVKRFVNRMTWRLQRKHITEGDEYIVRNTLHRAFNEWSSVCNVHFEEIHDGQADFSISFEKEFHDDKYPFDGPDGIVAHAFFPRDGRLHFDADEEWTLNQQNGVNLYQTALHEIGHLLGLEHSNDPRAAMYASKRPYNPLFTLSDDDVRAARVLFPYHSTTKETSTTTTTQSTTTVTESSSTTTVTESPSTTTVTESRPVFRLLPVYSSHRSNPIMHSDFSIRSRGHIHRKRIRGYSMLSLEDNLGNEKKSSFFSQQADLQPFRL